MPLPRSRRESSANVVVLPCLEAIETSSLIRTITGSAGRGAVPQRLAWTIVGTVRQRGHVLLHRSTAPHEVLRALGCEGESLKDLFNSTCKQDLFAGHDSALVEAVKKLLGWSTASRSNISVAHAMNAGSRADAQLALHVSAALMLRLIAMSTIE